MALTDGNEPSPQFSPSLPGRPALPLLALERLSELHAESGDTADLAQFLAGAVNAAAALTLLGMAALTFEAGASLKSCFSWALLVLMGIGALLRSYIRSTAAAFDRAPLDEAAKDLRAILLYAGFAWGAGAFLMLPSAASPLSGLSFAVLPPLGLALLLKDRDGPLAFLLPVTAMSLAAAVLRPWSDAGVVTALTLMLHSSIAAYVILRGRKRRAGLPPGLLLR
jgi:hypothetical protein